MAKLTQEEKEKLVKRYLPGYKVVPQSEKDTSTDNTASERVDAGTPDLEALKQKYFGTAAVPTESKGADSALNDEEDEIVQVEPERRSNPLDPGGRAKSIVISGKEIKGSQG